jgi:YgiT-type zinc finger domain-containing protein
MIRLQTCPICGSRALKPVHGSIVLRVKRRKFTVPDLDFIRCDACGEQLFDSEANRKIDAFSASKPHRVSRRKSA